MTDDPMHHAPNCPRPGVAQERGYSCTVTPAPVELGADDPPEGLANGPVEEYPGAAEYP